MSEHFVKRVCISSVTFLSLAIVFAYGLAVERYHIWPYEAIHSAYYATKSLAEYGEIIPEGRRIPAPADAARKTITIHNSDRVSDGYYVFVGWDSESMVYAAWLYDDKGERQHTWLIDYYALDPDGPSNGSDNPHPFYILRDGSIIAGFDKGDVMVRLDACGEPIWTKDGIFHHALSRAEDGSFWTWRGQGTAIGHYHYLENFDAGTGEKIREIGLIEDIIAGMGPSSVLFGVRPDFPFEIFERDPDNQLETDLFHPNDVDVLDSNMAPMFPMFDEGNLLLSFRTTNLIAVVDPDDRRVIWWNHGPWVGQHDPDFTSDGKISVYNNNTGRGRSEIIKMDPITRDVSNELFYGDASFQSEFMGKHQYLPNGNVLIVVPGEGRILEVTDDGGQVMEFNNLSSYSPDYNEHVQNGMWVPSDYFQTVPQCQK